MRQLAGFAATLLLLAACAPSDQVSGEADAADTGVADAQGADAGAGEPVWYGDVDALVSTWCGACHTAGGAGPFALDSPDAWATWGASAVAAIDEGRMPPWQADPSCRTYLDQAIVPQVDRDRVRAWFEGGMSVGDATAASPPPTPDAAVRADIVGTLPAPYTPDFSAPDDYRCFVLDVDFDRDVYVVGSQVEPGNALVHHVLVYALEGDSADRAREMDGGDGRPGYTCFGAPVPFDLIDPNTLPPINELGAQLASFGGFPSQVGAWVPGQRPSVAPDGVATRVSAGSVIVMQVHYSALGGETLADAGTRLVMQTSDEQPAWLRVSSPVALRDLTIPAGEPVAVNQMTLPYYGDEPLVVRGLAAHMHLLGDALRADIVRADGQDECGLSVVGWDFQWQRSYLLPEDAWLTIAEGDAVRLTCTYDNSAANQAVVNGVQQAPQDVAWGEGTQDEMCLLYLDTVHPFTAASTTACPTECAGACPPDDFDCQMRCGGADLGCVGCALDAIVDCAGIACVAPLAAQRGCFTTCATSAVMLQGNAVRCVAEECGELWPQMVDCVTPAWQGQSCQSLAAACGLL